MPGLRRWISGAVFLAMALVLAYAAGRAAGAAPPAVPFGALALTPRPDLTVSVGTSRPEWPKRRTIVTVTVKNIGEAPCPKSVCYVFIRNAHPPHETLKVVKKAIRALDAGDQFGFSFPVEFGLGLFEIEAMADRNKRIAESDETNNGMKITVAGR